MSWSYLIWKYSRIFRQKQWRWAYQESLLQDLFAHFLSVCFPSVVWKENKEKCIFFMLFFSFWNTICCLRKRLLVWSPGFPRQWRWNIPQLPVATARVAEESRQIAPFPDSGSLRHWLRLGLLDLGASAPNDLFLLIFPYFSELCWLESTLNNDVTCSRLGFPCDVNSEKRCTSLLLPPEAGVHAAISRMWTKLMDFGVSTSSLY